MQIKYVSNNMKYLPDDVGNEISIVQLLTVDTSVFILLTAAE